jgi:hypothetical protein
MLSRRLFSAKVMVFRLVHFSNALWAMVYTLAGTRNEVIPDCAKACIPIRGSFDVSLKVMDSKLLGFMDIFVNSKTQKTIATIGNFGILDIFL